MIKSFVSPGLLVALLLSSEFSIASVSNVISTLNGATGPQTFAPGGSFTASLTADITNDGSAIIAWRSTEFGDTSGTLVCYTQPDPDVVPAPAATQSGTAAIGTVTAPSVPGDYIFVWIMYEGAGCTGALRGTASTPVTVAAPAAKSVPTIPLLGLIITAASLIFLGRRKMRA